MEVAEEPEQDREGTAEAPLEVALAVKAVKVWILSFAEGAVIQIFESSSVVEVVQEIQPALRAEWAVALFS
jgi:hypothetical protein